MLMPSIFGEDYLKICLIYHSMMTVRLRRNCMADMQRIL